MKKNDTTIYFIIALFCVAMFPAISAFVEEAGDYEISPSFWPLMSVCLCLLFSIAAFVIAIKNGQKFIVTEIFSGIIANKTQIIFLILAALYLYAMNYAGFLVSSLVMLPVMLFFFGYRKYLHGLVISVVFILAVYFIFSEVFRIHFPEWVFEWRLGGGF